MRILLTSFYLCCIWVGIIAQSKQINPKVSPIWFQPKELEATSFAWKAQWIWMNEEITSDVMLARKSFELTELPTNAQLRITATSQYQLYINGEYIQRGPARSAPHHQSFDILNIKDFLHSGQNTLAIRVHYQSGKYSYHHDGRSGLLVQLDMINSQDKVSIISDATWKTSPDLSWDNQAPKISRFQLVVNDKVDLRKQIKGWEQNKFNDSEWMYAKPLMRNVGWPSPQKNAPPQALTPPWTSLVPRDVPYLLEKEVNTFNLIQASKEKEDILMEPMLVVREIDSELTLSFSAFQKAQKPLEIPASAESKIWMLLFDFGKVLNGMPMLDIEGAEGSKIDILCAAFIVNNQFTQQIVDSDFRDQIILSGEKDSWEATYFKPTRYMGIVLRSGKEPIKLHRVGIRSLAYPFEAKGSIVSKNAPWVEKYTEASAKTIEVCTTDAYTDNYRERRQYAQTGYYAALGNYYTFGDYALQRRYLVQIAQEQEANGMMPAYAPLAKDDFMIIMDSNCLWLRSLKNYFLYSGDEKTTKELLPTARKLIALLHSYTNDLGFIYNPPYSYWLDHALNDRRGANFSLNGHYLGALEDFAQILDWLKEDDHKVFQARADLLRKSLRTHLWDEEKQLFADAWIDGQRSNQFSEHANGMALAMKVANPSQAQSIATKLLEDDALNYIKRASGMNMVTPAMSYFLHKGLCDYGYIDESFAMFRKRFDKMLAPNTNQTLWEEWWLDGTGRSGKLVPKSRSDAQTESAFPPALFARYLLGIIPLKPGLKEVRLIRPATKLAHIQGNIPTPEGNLFIEWSSNKDEGLLIVDIPGEMKLNINLESFATSEEKVIELTSQTEQRELAIQSEFILTKGKYTFQF